MNNNIQQLPPQGYICIHEDKLTRHDEQIKHSTEIQQELKQDISRFETKLDKVLKEIHEQTIQSNTNDNHLELRLKAIETELSLTKETTNNNRKDTNLKLTALTALFALITLYFQFLK